MPIRSEDLHGFVPDTSGTAILLIDVINDFEFDGGEQLLELALPMGHNIAELKSRAKAAKVSSIYVNDNFGKWQLISEKSSITVAPSVVSPLSNCYYRMKKIISC